MKGTMLHRLITLLLSIAILAALPLAAMAEVRTDGVKKVSIAEKPAKLAYMIGEKLDPTDGVLKVTYSDKSTALVPMTDPAVEYTNDDFTSGGKKSVNVKFGGKVARLSVTVSDAGYTVSFETGCDAALAPASVVGGAAVAAPEITREGYTLLGWYTDADFTTAFDFGSPVNSDMTLYACWLQEGAQTVNVHFDYDYYGDVLTAYTRVVASGDVVAEPTAPLRMGYTFDRWLLNGEAYDFTQPVNTDITLTAAWTKDSSDAHTYVFEAEDTDLTGKEGIGSSGASTEKAMIKYDPTGKLNASNERWVSYLYKPNLSVDFLFASDVTTQNAVLSLSYASELPGRFECTPENYTVELNGMPIDFAPFVIENTGAGVMSDSFEFQTVVLAEGVELKAGANVLRVYPSNNTTINGTTYQAIGPMVDCVKITTDAVLIWDAVKGLPAANY